MIVNNIVMTYLRGVDLAREQHGRLGPGYVPRAAASVERRRRFLYKEGDYPLLVDFGLLFEC